MRHVRATRLDLQSCSKRCTKGCFDSFRLSHFCTKDIVISLFNIRITLKSIKFVVKSLGKPDLLPVCHLVGNFRSFLEEQYRAGLILRVRAGVVFVTHHTMGVDSKERGREREKIETKTARQNLCVPPLSIQRYASIHPSARYIASLTGIITYSTNMEAVQTFGRKVKTDIKILLYTHPAIHTKAAMTERKILNEYYIENCHCCCSLQAWTWSHSY